MEASVKRTVCRRILVFLVCACLLPMNIRAKADSLQNAATAIIVGVAAVGAAIGIGIYYALHHGNSIKGCVVSGPSGLELQNEGDQQTFQLSGITSDVKPGDRMRVSGKKVKRAKGSSGNPTFLVDKPGKDYGAC